MAQVQENDGSAGRDNNLFNTGVIDFRGERSIGMYVYLPQSISADTRTEAILKIQEKYFYLEKKVME